MACSFSSLDAGTLYSKYIEIFDMNALKLFIKDSCSLVIFIVFFEITFKFKLILNYFIIDNIFSSDFIIVESTIFIFYFLLLFIFIIIF